MTAVVDAPERVDGVQLLGEMVGSGYREPPALVRRADGQVLQLTPLLYLVLNALDGRRGCEEIAHALSDALRRGITAEHVQTMVDSHLRPLGLVRGADGSEAELRRSSPLLALKYRFAVTNPRTTRRLTDPFRVLFRPFVVAVMLVGFLAVTGWVFFERGLGASAYDAFERPQLLLLVFVVTLFSAGLHEFGHAAAARYSGAQPGVMGAGLYLVWPAFYTDVTDSYSLGRGGRIRTDLGGLYFNAIVVVLTFVWWMSTGWEALLLLVATQVLQMVQQLLPLLRFDGYHLLADIAGVPDLYNRIKPTLLGLLPHRWRSPENRALKPSARAVITFWVFVTIPLMGLMLWTLVKAVPRVLGSAGSAIAEDARAAADAWGAGGAIDIAAHSLQVLAVVLPVLGGALILGRLGFRFYSGLFRWSQGSAPKRVVAVVTGGAVAAGLGWMWWPDSDTYRPIEPGEKGTFAALLQEPPESAATAPMQLSSGGLDAETLGRTPAEGPLVATFEQGRDLPTKDHPVLAMVLVPRDDSGDAESGSTTEQPGETGETEETWVFPFDRPLPEDEGDNQALAVATEDGSVAYDLAFALVWADGDEVLNVNEAHAYASCSDCVSVAVAFQVVLITDNAHVVVPQNLAVAANYDCYRCITAAIASQLVLSVDGEPGEEDLRALGEVWGRLTAFAQEITSYSLTEIAAQLKSFEAEIVAILGETPATDSQETSTGSDEATGSATPSPTSQASATASATSRSSTTSSPTSQATATATRTTTATATQTTPSSSPTPTGTRTATASSSP